MKKYEFDDFIKNQQNITTIDIVIERADYVWQYDLIGKPIKVYNCLVRYVPTSCNEKYNNEYMLVSQRNGCYVYIRPSICDLMRKKLERIIK